MALLFFILFYLNRHNTQRQQRERTHLKLQLPILLKVLSYIKKQKSKKESEVFCVSPAPRQPGETLAFLGRWYITKILFLYFSV